MASLADRLDGYQRQHRWLGFPLAVTYKFFDDQSNYLAATVTYYAFVAIFPLLLISSSVLGFILQGNDALKTKVLASTLAQFPIVGTALGSPQGLQGNVAAVVIGSIAALYGILGLGQAAQNAVHVAYATPRNSRPNPFLSRLQSGLYLLLAGAAVVAVATLTSVASNVGAFGAKVDWTFGLLVDLVSILLTASVFAVLIRTATSRRESYRRVFVGSLVTAVMWQLLQKVGRVYVNHVVTRAHDEVNGVFAVTLGLVALIYVAANMAVIGVQVNVVLARHLWPRALLTPFTDAVQLTDADRRAYAAYAKAQRHKGFEKVEVTFHPDQEPAVDGSQIAEPPQQDARRPEPEPGASSGGG